jgi:hypothetical protein|tara:strand:- start:16466 stop:16825 length:360 start_codon:yes stop_codon:yes gene_type:complete
MNIYVDIDETICRYTSGDKYKERDYSSAAPIEENIACINKLYDLGHTIVYWTARGTVTKIDWSQLTIEQLKGWGAKFTEVQLGKPAYDVFICDKAINSDKFFKNFDEILMKGEGDVLHI